MAAVVEAVRRCTSSPSGAALEEGARAAGRTRSRSSNGASLLSLVAATGLACVRPALEFAPDAAERVLIELPCCDDPACRLPVGEACSCKACRAGAVCPSGACRELPSLSSGYCLETRASAPCAVALEQARIDIQSVCTVDRAPAECSRRLLVHADAGVTAEVVVRAPNGLRSSAPVVLEVPEQGRTVLATAFGLFACETPSSGEECLTGQPFVVVSEVASDGGARPLFAFSLGSTSRPSRQTLDGLDVLQQLSAPLWADAGLAYVP